MQMALENGSVTTLTYEKGTFTIQGINDISYIEKGKRSLKSAVCLKRRLSVKMTDNLLYLFFKRSTFFLKFEFFLRFPYSFAA